MNPTEILFGLVVGALGSGLHLAVTRWRAGVAVSGRTTLALATLPVGLAGPAAALWTASLVSNAAVGFCALSVWLTRWSLLSR